MRFRWNICAVVALGVALLAACKGAPAATPTPAQSPQATQAPEAAYPGAAYPEVNYPGPAYPGVTEPVSAYPYPESGSEFVLPTAAYPAPGEETAQPGLDAPPAANPYPGSGTEQPLDLQPTGTAAVAPTEAATPTPEFTPTPLPSPTPTGPTPTVRVQLLATDPRKVKLNAGRVQLVEFFAFWCGTCRAIAPVVQGLEGRYGERVNFVYLDIDDPAVESFKGALRFRSEPHIFLLDKDGKVLRQWQGYVEQDDLAEAINAALQ